MPEGAAGKEAVSEPVADVPPPAMPERLAKKQLLATPETTLVTDGVAVTAAQKFPEAPALAVPTDVDAVVAVEEVFVAPERLAFVKGKAAAAVGHQVPTLVSAPVPPPEVASEKRRDEAQHLGRKERCAQRYRSGERGSRSPAADARPNSACTESCSAYNVPGAQQSPEHSVDHSS